jgi:hypothetical protein
VAAGQHDEPVIPGLVSVTFRRLTVADIVARAGLRAAERGADVHVPTPEAARCADAGIEICALGSDYRAGSGAGLADVLRTMVTLGVWAGEHGFSPNPTGGR